MGTLKLFDYLFSGYALVVFVLQFIVVKAATNIRPCPMQAHFFFTFNIHIE